MMPAIKPSKEVLDINGSVSYSMSSRAWNTLRIKKELLEEFPLLRERREKIDYKMVLYRDPVDLFLAAEKIMDAEDALPILLYFTRRTEQGTVKIKPKKHRIIEAKAKAAEFRKVIGNSERDTKSIHELGFSNNLEFIHYHWEKLSEKDREELLAAGVPEPHKKISDRRYE